MDWLSIITEIQSIAQSGLAYAHNEYDKGRYIRLAELASELAAGCTKEKLEDIQNLFSIEKGYATPKLDVRAVILHNHKLLLVKERADGLWSLPGGWADVNESPSEAIIREVLEETGYEVSAVKLLALWDKLKHDHPPQWPHTYKCFFHCNIEAGQAKQNLEISEIGFFEIENLPELSLHRVTNSQITRLYELVVRPCETHFD